MTCLLISGRFGRHVDASDAAVDDTASDDAVDADKTPSEACDSCNDDSDSSSDAKILHRVTTDAKNDDVIRERSKATAIERSI